MPADGAQPGTGAGPSSDGPRQAVPVAVPGRPRPAALAGRAFGYWWATYRRTWRGSLWSSFLSPVLYLAAMGIGLGALVDRGAGVLDGVAYVHFVAPGVLAATAMTTAAEESSWPVMGAIRWQRQYHAMLATPLGVTDVVLGHLGFVAFRVATSTAAFLAVAALLGAWVSPWTLAAWPVVVLCGVAFGACVAAFAATQETEGGFNVLFRFVLVPMFLFSGTFFPVSQLPELLQWVAWVTPLWHAVDAARDLALGTAVPLEVLGHCGYLALWAAAGVAVGRRALHRRMVV